MELELGLALPNQGSTVLDLNSCSNEMEIENRHHRGEEEEEEVESKSSLSSLLSWSGQYHDAPNPERTKNLHLDVQENEEDIIGWPPINSSSLHEHAPLVMRQRNHLYQYVKVRMEGVAIGRKIDLTLYHSYQSLTDSLFRMFAKYIQNDRSNNENFRILYQDTEGDWMLAGDVPWGAFVESVQRMKILRNFADH